MKPSLPFSLLIGAALSIVPLQMTLADASSDDAFFASDTGAPIESPAGTSTAPSANSGATMAQRAEQIRKIFAQLDLTDKQKEQIKQDCQTITDRKERREAIMKILTPEQKARLWQLLKERKSAAQQGSNP